MPSRQVLLPASFAEDKLVAQRNKVILSPTQRVLFKSWSFSFQILCDPASFSHCPSNPWQPWVLLGDPWQCSQAGPRFTLDKEDECPHGFPGRIVDFTAV